MTSNWSAFDTGVQTTDISGMFGIGSPFAAAASTAFVTALDCTTFDLAAEFSAGTRPDAR